MNLDPLEMALRIPVLLLALTVHEFAHAYTAFRLGDPTAQRMGRCSLNPFVHLDPIGALFLLIGPIGWAKPVPVNPLNLRNPQRDDLLISGAGPASNLAMALLFALGLRLLRWQAAWMLQTLGSQGLHAAESLLLVGVYLNVGLAVFNMIPAYPLDGFHVLSNLAKGESRRRMLETARFGPMIIGLLVFSGMLGLNLLGIVMNPFLMFFLHRVAGYGS